MRTPTDGTLLARRSRPRAVTSWDVPSDSRPGVWYTVTERPDGSFECDCPDFTCRRAQLGEDCKHIVRYRP